MNEKHVDIISRVPNEHDNPTKDMSPEELVEFCRDYMLKIRHRIENYGMSLAAVEDPLEMDRVFAD